MKFKLNTPTASHAGAVWERMIRTVRNALNSLLEEHGSQLDEEFLRTLMCEAEAIVNSRPMAAPGMNVPEDEPLTPNHLLTMKSRVLLPPPPPLVESFSAPTCTWSRGGNVFNT